MDQVNKTLYIPLYGKAYVSSRGLILSDPKAEEIWAAEGFPLQGKAKSKWLAYYMGMRSAVFDGWLRRELETAQAPVVLHLGCGLDSRVLRVEAGEAVWYDVDFPQVIRERQRYFEESHTRRMVAADVRDIRWLEDIPRQRHALVVMEGISMYLTAPERNALLLAIGEHFDRVSLLMDCYTTFAARASRFKNPINTVGVTQVYGMDDPREPEAGSLGFRKEWDMTPQAAIDTLPAGERGLFRRLYAGAASRKLYRLYEYGKG